MARRPHLHWAHPREYKQCRRLREAAQLSPEQQRSPAAGTHHEAPPAPHPTGPGCPLLRWPGSRCKAQQCRVWQRCSLRVQAGGQRGGEETPALPGLLALAGSPSPLPGSPGAQEGGV